MAKKAAKKRKSRADVTADRKSVVWHALKYLGGKLASKDARNRLEADRSYQVELRIEGLVDGKAVEESIDGELRVGTDTPTTSSSNPDYVGLVGYLLGELPARRRLEVRSLLPDYFSRHEQLPEIDARQRDEAESLLADLRSRKAMTSRGKVTFVRTPEAEV